MGSTNYYNTLIEVAEDSKYETGELPPIKVGKVSVANLQFDMVYENPYKYTSDDVLYTVFAVRKEIPPGELQEQRDVFFSKGQPCFRASPLTKSYGWGLHSNAEGKVALYAVESEEYDKLVNDDAIKKTKAMRTKKVSK